MKCKFSLQGAILAFPLLFLFGGPSACDAQAAKEGGTGTIWEIPRTDEDYGRFELRLYEKGRGNAPDPIPAIAPLWQVTDPKLAPVLAKRLVGSTSWRVKAGCVLALSHMNTPEANDGLAAFLKATPPVREGDKDGLAAAGAKTDLDVFLRTWSIRSAARLLVERGRFDSVKDDMLKLFLGEEIVLAGRTGVSMLLERQRLRAEAAPEEFRRGIAGARSADCLDLLREAAKPGSLSGFEMEARNAVEHIIANEAASKALFHAAELLDWDNGRDRMVRIQFYSEILDLYPESTVAPEAMRDKARVLEHVAADYDKAVDCYFETARVFPRTKSARDALARGAVVSGFVHRYSEGIEAVDTLLRWFPDDPDKDKWLIVKGKFLVWAGEKDRARETLKPILDGLPGGVRGEAMAVLQGEKLAIKDRRPVPKPQPAGAPGTPEDLESFLTKMEAPAPPQPPLERKLDPNKKYDVPKTPEELKAVLDDLEQFAKENHQNSPGGMLYAVTQIRDPKLVPTLAERLAASNVWVVKAGCVMALAQVNTAESTTALRRFVKSVPTWSGEEAELEKMNVRSQVDRWMFAGSIKGAVGALIARGEFASITEDLKRFLMYEELAAAGKPGLDVLIELSRELAGGKRKKAGLSKIDSYFAFAKVRGDECLPALKTVVFNETMAKDARRGALTAISDGWGAKEYAFLLLAARTVKDSIVRDCAYSAATKADPAAAHAELLALLNGRDRSLHRTAISLLGGIGEAKDVPAIEKFLDDDSDDMRLIALVTLWRIEHVPRNVKWRDPRYQQDYERHMRLYEKREK